MDNDVAIADAHLIAEEPHDAGLDESEPDVAHIEAARVLADEARGGLEALGFTEPQVRHWAEAYCREEGSGDVAGLHAWIATREGWTQ